MNMAESFEGATRVPVRRVAGWQIRLDETVVLSTLAICPSTTAIMSGVISATSQKRRRVAKPNSRQAMTEMATSIIQTVGGMR